MPRNGLPLYFPDENYLRIACARSNRCSATGLHCAIRTVNIVVMFLRRPFRRFLACATAALFLACQGMALASTSLPDLSPFTAGTAQAPCHDMGEQGDKTAGDTCHAPCQYQNASSTPFTSIHAVTDLPAITVALDYSTTIAPSAPRAVAALTKVEAPPLRILHCCLRN